MERVEEFNQDGKDFIYYDLSFLKSNEEFKKTIEEVRALIVKYEPHSVYTITNIEGVVYDSETKEMVAEWMASNKDYVKYGAVTGIDGIKRIMVNVIFKKSGRTNMGFFNKKEQAIEWLLSKR